MKAVGGITTGNWRFRGLYHAAHETAGGLGWSGHAAAMCASGWLLMITVAQRGVGGTSGACTHCHFVSSLPVFHARNLADIQLHARSRYPLQRLVARDGESMWVRWFNSARCR